MSKFTPGPWRVSYGNFVGSGKYLRVTCGRNEAAGPVRERFYEFPAGCKPTEEQVANAFLIGAAPELYNACKLLLLAYEGGEDGESVDWEDLDDVVEAAREAIARADRSEHTCGHS